MKPYNNLIIQYITEIMFLFFLSRKQFRISTIFLAYRHESIKENSPFHYFQYLSTVVLMKWSYFFTFRIPAKVPNAKINRVVPDFEKNNNGRIGAPTKTKFFVPNCLFLQLQSKVLGTFTPFSPSYLYSFYILLDLFSS